MFGFDRIRNNLDKFSEKIHKEVENNWKWEKHVPLWEKYMEDCIE